MSTKTKQELVEASEHVHYEFSLAVALSRHLARATPVEKVPANQHLGLISNAIIGSTAMAVRSLLGFAYEMGASRDKDIFATHYVSKWNSVRPSLDPVLEKLYERASKGVAHLSYARSLAGMRMELNGIQVFNALVPLHNAFVEHVERDCLLHPLWDDSLANRLELMPADRSRIDFGDFEASFTNNYHAKARAPRA